MHGSRHQRIKQAHEHAGQQTQQNAPGGNPGSILFPTPIGNSIDHNGHRHQGHSNKEQPHVAGRGEGIVQQYPDHQGQPNSQGKRHGQTRNLNGDDQQKISGVENDAAGQR